MNVFEKINWTLFLGILGGLIVIFVAFAQWNEKKKEELKAELNEKKADSATNELKELQSKSLQKTEELTEAYKQIANLQEEIKNQITGGNSIPYLKLLTTKIISSNSGEKYFIVFFSLELKGKFPLQNVKCTIYDNESLTMLTHGVSHIRDGLSYTSGNPSAKDISNYNAVKKFDVGTLTNKAPNTLYMASCHYDANLKAKPHFNVEINWNNGSLTHFISLSAENNLVKFKSVESIFNGEKIETYEKYMGIENAK